jgi:hypothetical protein
MRHQLQGGNKSVLRPFWLWAGPAIAWVLLGTTGTDAAQSTDVLFHASFDRGLDADFSVGPGEATLSGDRKNQIKPVAGLRGNGVLVGARDSHLIYSTQGNLLPEKGTIEFWYKPVNWGPSIRWTPEKAEHKNPPAEGYGFRRWWFASGNVQVHQNYYAGWLSTPRIIFSLKPTYEDMNRWRYYVITWDRAAGEATVYIDAYTVRPSTAKEGIAAMEFGPTMEIGNYGTDGSPVDCDKIIDELRIWNRPLRPEEINHQYRKGIEMRTAPVARIKKTSRKVQIDGIMDEPEWADATVISGLIDAEEMNLSPVPTQFLLMYDNDSLYVGMHSDIPAEDKANPAEKLLFGIVKNDVVTHDEWVYFDDSMKVFVWEPAQSTLYQLWVNGVDTTYDLYQTFAETDEEFKITGDVYSWEPKWKTKSVVDMAGWHLEAEIPFADLKVDPADNRELQVDIGRIWQKLRQNKEYWATGILDNQSGKSERIPNLGTLVLAGDENVTVKILKFGVSPTNHDLIDFSAQIKNLYKTKKTVTLNLQTDKNPALLQEIVLKPGQVFDFESAIQFGEVNDSINVQVIDASDAKLVYYRQTVPVYSPHTLSIKTKHYLTNRVMTVYWRLAKTSAPLSQLRGTIRIRQASNDEVIVEKNDISFENLISSTDISTKALASGNYKVETVVQHDDSVLARLSTPFVLKAAEAFPWFNSKVGVPTSVPPPWTPMAWDDVSDSIHCWGRKLRYDRNLLPTQIVNQGQDMLAGPMQLVLTDADGQQVKSGTGPADVGWVEQSELKMHAERNQPMGPVKTQVNSYTEFDGFVWLDVTVAPGDSAPSSLTGLALEVPLKAEWATLVRSTPFNPRTTGIVPEAGIREVLFCNWIGNEVGGIQFFSETTGTWELQNHQWCFEVEPGGEETTLRINLVDHAYTLDKPHTFSFGFMVTPARPMPKNYRRWILGPTKPEQAYPILGRPDAIYIPLYVQGWSKHYLHDFDGHPLAENYPEGPYSNALFRSADIEIPEEAVVRKDVCLYVSGNRVPVDAPEYTYWVDEWMVDTSKHAVITPGGSGPRLCPGSPSLVDFRVWGMAETQKVLGNTGYYFDVTFPKHCNNLHHGCGQVDRNGKVHPTYNLLALRRFMKRLYVAMKLQRPDAMIAYHSSSRTYMPFFPFCDLLLDGESYYFLLDTANNKTYENFLDLDTFRAQHLGHNLGSVNALLPQFRRRGSLTYEEAETLFARDGEVRPYGYLIGLILLHDSQLWPSYMWSGSGCYDIYKVMGELNFDERYRLIPYWSQQITKLPEKIVASFYVDTQSKKRALMVLVNVDADGEDQQLTVDLDWARLGLNPAKVRVRNAMHNDPVKLLANGKLEVPAPALTYRLVVIEE